MEVGRVAGTLFLFALAATIAGVGMQLYLFVVIQNSNHTTLKKFIDCTASVQAGLQGLAEEVAALRGRTELLLNASKTFQALLPDLVELG